MTDVTSAERGDGSAALSRLADIGTMLRRSDIALAVGMTAILVALILPLPLLLDFALAIPIIFSVLILMTSLFIPSASNSPRFRPCS
jgi:flagellar biosynthesis protein FlhA